MNPWNDIEEDDDDLDGDLSSDGQRWVDAALHDGWSRREAEELGREWDRLEEKDRFR